MEDAATDDAARTLRDIRFLNRWFGGHSILRQLLHSQETAEAAFSFLDVGAASGDMVSAVARACPQARVYCVDLHARYFLDNPHPKANANGLHLPFRDQSIDYVFCSLFLHHFPEPQVAAFLREFGRVAKKAVLAIDLERHPLALQFLPATNWLFRWNPMTLYDGSASVVSSFTAPELRQLAAEAGLQDIELRRHLPWFRYSLVARPAR